MIYFTSILTSEGANMKQYRVTVWSNSAVYKKYCYVVGLSDLDSYKKQLKLQYDRFTIEDTGRTL